MLTLHGFKTQNTLKTLYELEELGCDYNFVYVDLFGGEQNAEPFTNLTPVRKAPVLQVGDDALFESGAICRYLASVQSSSLYPVDPLQRGKVDQWMDFFSCHLGRWINAMYFEVAIKPVIDGGDADEKALEEATSFTRQQLTIINTILEEGEYLCGPTLTIADLFAFAYVEQLADLDFSVDEYSEVVRWLAALGSRTSVSEARTKVELAQAA